MGLHYDGTNPSEIMSRGVLSANQSPRPTSRSKRSMRQYMNEEFTADNQIQGMPSAKEVFSMRNSP